MNNKKNIFIVLISITFTLSYLITGFNLLSIKEDFYRGIMYIKIGSKVRKFEEIRTEIGYIIKKLIGDNIKYGVLRTGKDTIALVVKVDSVNKIKFTFEKVKNNFIGYNNRLLNLYKKNLHKNITLYEEVKESRVDKIKSEYNNKIIFMILSISGIFFGTTIYIASKGICV